MSSECGRWAVYYEDALTGEFYSQGSDEYEPWEVDRWGVMGIVHEHPVTGRKVVHRSDFYWFCPRNWWKGGDRMGLDDFIFNHAHHHKGSVTALVGREVSDPRFKVVWDMMMNDDRFPPRRGPHPREKERNPVIED